MIKILFVNTDLRGGGAEKVLVNLLNNLDYSKFDVTLFTVFKEGINRENLRAEVKQKWFFGNQFRTYSKIALFFSRKWLYKFFIKEKYDIIISYLEGFPSRIVSGGRDGKTILISWIHLEIYEDTLSYEFRSKKEARKVYNSFDKIVCVSETVRKCFLQCAQVSKQKIEVIYNLLDIEDILSKGKIKVLETSPKLRICTVGRLNKQKGYDRLLRIIKKLKQEDHIDFELIILGIGPLEKQFKKFIKENHLQDVVTLLGYQKNPYAYIKSSNLFVCSSYKEGYSTVVTESILLGTPVITTNCSGMSEILDNGKYGIIVDNEEEILYQGIKNILLDKQKLNYYKNKAIERAQFIKERNTILKFEHFIDKLVEAKKLMN